MARALPVLRIDRLARVTPTRSASSVSDMRRSSRMRSSWTRMAMAKVSIPAGRRPEAGSYRQLGLAAQPRALAEHLGEDEDDEDREGGGDEVEKARRLQRAAHQARDQGLADPRPAGDHGEGQADLLQAADIVGMKGVADAQGVHHGAQVAQDEGETA